MAEIIDTMHRNHDRDKLLAEWKEKKAAFDALQTAERDLRKQVIDAFSQEESEMASGVERVDIGYGFDLKIQHSLDYKLGARDLVNSALDEIEKSQEGGNVISERLVNWKPELSISNYRLLTAHQKAIIDRVLTIKPASKSIKIEPRK